MADLYVRIKDNEIVFGPDVLPDIFIRDNGNRLRDFIYAPEYVLMNEGFYKCPIKPNHDIIRYNCKVRLNNLNLPEWYLEEKTIDEIRLYKRSLLYDWHDSKLKAPCPTTLGFSVDVKEKDQDNWAKRLLAMVFLDLNSTIVRDFYNENHLLNRDQFVTLCRDVDSYVTENMEITWTVANIIDDPNSSIEDILSLNFDTLERNPSVS